MKPPESALEPEKFQCLEQRNLQVQSIEIFADDGREYSFASSHYLDTELSAHAGADDGFERERMVLRFTSGTVVLVGRGLFKVREHLATGGLAVLRAASPRHIRLLNHPPYITSIQVTRKEDL